MFSNTIMKHWHLLTSDPALNQQFMHPPLFVYKRAPYLCNKLVRAYLRTGPSQSLLAPLRDGNYPCGNCAQCHHTFKTFDFCHPRSGKRIPIKGVITCHTKNIIYAIRCPCDLYYVNKSTRCLKQQISEHKSSIRRNDPNYPVAVHLNKFSHNAASLRFFWH